MLATRLGPGRPAVKRDEILSRLKRDIIEGNAPPGARLPGRNELQQRFGASTATLQQALNRLIADGFVRVESGRGTFVVDTPPHLARYGLVFHYLPGGGHGFGRLSRYYEAMEWEAAALGRESGEFEIALYYGAWASVHGGSDYKRLVRDVRAHKVAGLIFPSPPFHERESPVLTEPGIPRVAIIAEPQFAGVSTLAIDTMSFLNKALDHFAARGRRRVAMMMNPTEPAPFDRLCAAMRARGFEVRRQWIQFVIPGDPLAARHCAEMLACPSDRPDALLMWDDNAVPHASAGLVAAGVRVPEEMDVVAHANFPWPTDCHVAAHRLGFNVRELLRRAMARIDAERRGESAGGAFEHVEAVFESDLPTTERRSSGALRSEGVMSSVVGG